MKKINRLVLLAINLIFTNAYAIDDPYVTHLACSGTEEWTSYWKKEKGEKVIVSTDYVLDFNDVTKKVTKATRKIALGCFPTETIDMKRSTCACNVSDGTVECKSVGYDGTKVIHEDEFSINRRTGIMINLRKMSFEGKIKSLEFGENKCKKIERKF